jgi:thiamine biosynthesis protein ThiI
MSSPQLSAEVGGAILTAMPHLKVDLYHPEVVVRVEIREKYAFLHAGADKGAGGLPAGGSGRAMLLLSGGIDSPVAGYMIAKRGATIEATHFDSFPYTSEQATEKVLDLGRKLCAYTGRMKVNIISLTKIQEAIRDNCEEDYFTLILRRFMMELASMTAEHIGAPVLITGESLGQVASQTTAAICSTEAAADRPIFRPCIGLDKEEIIRISRKIDTYDTSIEPYEDCCTVFTPRHPRTQPRIEKVIAAEGGLDREALIKEAFETKFTVTVRQFEDLDF